jgi:hypothetical protein
MTEPIVIHTVTFSNGECVITYTPSSAVKDIAGLPVIKMHQLVLPIGHPSYGEIREIHEALQDLVRDIDEDYGPAEVYDESKYEDDGDEDGG